MAVQHYCNAAHHYILNAITIQRFEDIGEIVWSHRSATWLIQMNVVVSYSEFSRLGDASVGELVESTLDETPLKLSVLPEN